MFTGLIQEVGKIAKIEPTNGGMNLSIQAPGAFLRKLDPGDSVAVNGACQTVEDVEDAEEVSGGSFGVFSVPETLRVTNLGLLEKHDLVNLELPLRLTDRLGGHIVQGHVDTAAEIEKIFKGDGYWDITIRYAHPGVFFKSSIALDGISLTVQKVSSSHFSVQIIPETLKKTNIIEWKEGKKVNIEVDYLVKAVQNKHSFC